jgi:hypothetical protein
MQNNKGSVTIYVGMAEKSDYDLRSGIANELGIDYYSIKEWFPLFVTIDLTP